jgi:glycosyltransferase involved in cell wall biosynthesis
MNSALAQDYPAYEVLVVDDGSTDNTAAVAASVSGGRIHLLSRSLSGPGGYAARNLGVEAAGGEWVAFLDADDEWLPGHLSAFAALHAATPQSSFLSTGWEILEPSGRHRTNHHSARFAGEGLVAMDLATFLKRWSTGRAPAWTSAVCIRRDTLLAVGAFPEDRCTRGGDVDTWLRVMLAERLLAYDPEPTAVYHREVETSVTARRAPQVHHCTAHTIRQVLRGNTRSRERRLLKRLGNFHKKDPLRKKARGEGIGWSDLSGFYPEASPLFFLLAVLLVLVPAGPLRRLWRLRRWLRDRKPGTTPGHA